MGLASVIDDIATHLTNQRDRATGDHGCVLRGQGGTMCAVGAIIPDDLIDFDIWNTSSASCLYNGDRWIKICGGNRGGIDQFKDYMSGLMPELNSSQQVMVLSSFQSFHDTFHSTVLYDEQYYPSFLGLAREFSDDKELYEEISASLWILAAHALKREAATRGV